MVDLNIAFAEAFKILFQMNSDLIEIIFLSIKISFVAITVSCLISMPFATFLSIKKFPGRNMIVIIINSFMALPPVVVGLFLYLLASVNGPLSTYQLLYTPMLMVIAQIIIIIPIVTALSKESIDSFYSQYRDYFLCIKANQLTIIRTLMYEARHKLVINGLAGLGRALSEVGAVIIVGGNIAHLTRVMTTSIVLETSRGELAMALSIGFVLISLSIALNFLVYFFRRRDINYND